ncbi:porin [Sutterella sp.]|uniref:porin n=1 Tax=Sutterella sp. TaxID=1981025 RepID=UPI0026E089D0|nr:porin [Sutterella sp.]MDO5532510.1 porin [Sutterella sp.]
MKKILAVAVAAAFVSGAAAAADVEVYGVVDTGLVYSRTTGNHIEKSDTFSMDTGVNAGSRFGLRGSEDLGNGYAVSFKLENGFGSDDGTLKQGSRLFGREARVSLETPYANVSFGRMGALTSGCGTYDIFMAGADSMDGGYANYIGVNYWFQRDRYDNMVTIDSAEFAGAKLYAQYSFANDVVGENGEGSNAREATRYVAGGATYNIGDLSLVAVVDSVMYKHTALVQPNDSLAVSLGGSYKIDFATVFVGFQWGQYEKLDLSSLLDVDGAFGYFDGYNVHVGANFDLPCGVLSTSVYYGDYEASSDSNIDAEKWGVGLMHNYPLSKRTTIYTGVGYQQSELSGYSYSYRVKGLDATVGLTHKF